MRAMLKSGAVSGICSMVKAVGRVGQMAAAVATGRAVGNHAVHDLCAEYPDYSEIPWHEKFSCRRPTYTTDVLSIAELWAFGHHVIWIVQYRPLLAPAAA